MLIFLLLWSTIEDFLPTLWIIPILVSLILFLIDISDGLLADLDKMINTQKLSYKIFLQDIPISNNLKMILDLKILPKINCISNGDDYQVLFTASKNKTRIIKKIASNYRVKLTKIGSIQSHTEKSSIIDCKNRKITLKNKGYFHKF